MAAGTGVEIKGFGKSFGSGMAFCAVMHGLIPELVPIAELSPENRKENFELAFR